MIIITIVLAVTGGGGGGAAPSKGGDESWTKKKLKDLAELLKRLGLKAIDALPGIIGSIVSWLLSTLTEAVGWLANNIWALVVAAGLLMYDYLRRIPNK